MNRIVQIKNEPAVRFTPELTRYLLWLWRWWDYTVEDDNGNSIVTEKDILRLTKFDLQSIPHDAEDWDIIKMINTDLWVDITTAEWLDVVNKSFRTAINLYGWLQIRQVFERKHAPYSLIQTKEEFSNTQELVDFIRKAWISSWESRLYCLIIKVTSAVHDYIAWPLNGLNLVDSDFWHIVFNALWLTMADWDKQYQWFIAWVPIDVYGEPKSQESSVWKSLSNPKYQSSEKILDWIRYTFHLGRSATERDALSVMEVVYWTLAWLNPIIIQKIEDKWIINHTGMSQTIRTPWFDIALQQALEAGKKNGTNWKYKEIKVVWRFKWVGFEIKVALGTNENQDWLSFQGFYVYTTKYIWQQIRLASNGYVNDYDVISMAESFYKNIPYLIRINPEIRASKTPENLYDEIWNDLVNEGLIRRWMKLRDKTWRIRDTEFILWIASYFKKKLYCVRLDNGEIVWTNSRWMLLSQQWYYPNMDRRLSSQRIDETGERRKPIKSGEPSTHRTS